MTSHGRSNNLIDIESPNAEPQLQFQDFPVQNTGDAAKLDINSHTLTFNHVPETPGSSSAAGLSPGTPFSDAENLPAHSIWSIEFYKKLFDVNTDQVVDRIVWAMIPKPGVNYLQHHIQSKPDLYGPFWICITLVFTIAISGNLANYLQFAASQKYHWRYDFHAVTLAATAIFAYAWLLPSALWGILKWQGSNQLGFLELLCVYGYSLAIYVPVSVLWVIQISWLQWLLVLVGAAMSGSVLVTAVWPALGNRSIGLLAAILGFHLLLAVGFMLSFFHVTPPAQ